MPMRYLFPLLGLLLGMHPALGLTVSGAVFNKLAEPLGFAKVCLRGTTTCVNAGLTNGQFLISGSLGTADGAPPARDFAVGFHGKRISLRVPTAMRADLAWYDAGGRRLGSPLNLSLAAGDNDFAAPRAGAPGAFSGGAGLRFLRLSARNFTVTWKALFLDGGEIAASPSRTGGAAPAASVASLAKTAALAPAIIVSRAGYQSQLYFPTQDPDTAFIFLAANADTGFTLSTTDKYTVLSLENQAVVTEYTVKGCDSAGQVVSQTFPDSLGYALRDGKLYLFYAGDCFGLKLGGGGTSVKGTWTVESWAVLPADIRPPTCAADPFLPPEPQSISQHRYVIGDSVMLEELTGEACPADYWVDILMSGFLSVDTAVALTKNTCRQAVFKNGAGGVATLTHSLAGDSLASVFSFNAHTCSLRQAYQPETNPDCSKDPEGDFLNCIGGTGFIPIPVAKTSAMPPRSGVRFRRPAKAPMSMEKWGRSAFGGNRFLYQR